MKFLDRLDDTKLNTELEKLKKRPKKTIHKKGKEIKKIMFFKIKVFNFLFIFVCTYNIYMEFIFNWISIIFDRYIM